MPRRKKLSTTISPEGYAFLRSLIRSGRAESLAQAVDLALEEVRQIENRRRLEQATAEYYASASQEAIDEENSLATAFAATAGEIDIDG
jgi:hypothetical protein